MFPPHHDRSRSRSRERNEPSGGYHGGRGSGGRGGFGGRSGRGSGGRGPALPPRPKGPAPVKVKTNFYELELQHKEWYMYKVNIFYGRFDKENKKVDFQYRRNDDGSFSDIKKSLNLERGSTPLSRRILKQLQQDLRENNIFMATDGHLFAYAPQPIFPDEYTHGTFDVRVKKDCEDDHQLADRVKVGHYKVELEKFGMIDRRLNTSLQLKVALEAMIKSCLMRPLESFGRSPRLFYFPGDSDGIKAVLSEALHTKYYGRAGTRSIDGPLVGLAQTVSLERDVSSTDLVSAKAAVNVDFGLDYFHRAKYLDRNPIKVLSFGNNGTPCIAGIPIHQTPIANPTLQQQITNKLMHMRFDVVFQSQSEEYRQKLLDKGVPEEQVDSYYRWQAHTNKTPDTRNNTVSAVLWAADDPSIFSFEAKVQDGGEIQTEIRTVYDHFQRKYNINLKYPKMPIVRLKGCGLFPIEFLYQAEEKLYMPEDRKDEVLKFYDEYSALKRSTHLTGLLDKANKMGSNNQEGLVGSLEDEFGLKLNISEPITVEATLLPEPRLKGFEINNGSWNLLRRRFSQPADFSSFAVLNLCRDDSPREFMKNLLRVMMEVHGIRAPQANDHDLQKLTETTVGGVENIDMIRVGFKKAIDRAKAHFLDNRRGDWFYTNVVSLEGELEKCLVKKASPHGDYVCVRPSGPTHHKKGDSSVSARLQFRVHANGRQTFVDPIDAVERELDKTFTNGTEVFVLDTKPLTYVEADQVEELSSYRVKLWQIECPAIIFVYLPEKKTQPYDYVKFCSQFIFGVPTQCAVSKIYNKQKNIDQYCSNIALKVNTKMFSSTNRSRAWDIFMDSSVEKSWISEVPTLVVGIGMSRAGREEKIIGVTVCLDDDCMQMAQTIELQSGNSEVISFEVMNCLITWVVVQFYSHRKVLPQRVVIFRDGVSDGYFEEVRTTEVSRVARILHTLYKRDEQACSPDCTEGCPLCTPVITFIIAQSQHNIRIVPTKGGGNVYSGTCVDDKRILSLDEKKELSRKTEGIESQIRFFNFEGFDRRQQQDFLLVAQGGLKGTSKGIYYRVLVNENYCWRPGDASLASPLTTEKLQRIIYAMSFQYGTATKAVRMVPVLQYSKRLAGMGASWLQYAKLEGRMREGDATKGEPAWIRRDHESDPEWIRRDVEPDSMMPPTVKSDLLPAFGPYETRLATRTPVRPPFRPHISA